ncbi:hypothetical protein [Catellatospora citrea]|uniref:Uncharacterized protein n=1 Tax=Catellatospora citrea TaxID=53366 RepID=A0A8J3K7L7_9ACTN|nr:hypothetical protein [Catellatospora citrea]RKE05238.1 hypothetical protein C8E86_0030 [Catellatospora citrea]GIF98166.1 hypothetical protein Cci01nite_32600 [Catellatospora citrea]
MALTLDRIAGYADRGLDADLARWFAAEPRVSIPDSVRSVEPFLAKLPPAAAASLSAFDRRVRSGTVPQFLDIFDWSYGFDFAANDCEILDADYATPLSSDDVWSIGADGSGSYHVVLTSGQVALWFHEEQVVEGHTRFDNLDVFLWSMVRYHAVRAGALDRSAVEDDFRSLAQPGVLADEVGLLAYLR